VNCPSCSAALPSPAAPCPSCGRRGPVVEGNLAPDLSRLIPARLDGTPARKRREPTWRDEVRQRVQERRRQRLGGELPLFPEAEGSGLDIALDADDVAELPLTPIESEGPDVEPALAGAEPAMDRETDEPGPRLVWSTRTPDAPPPTTAVADRWTLGDEAEDERGATAAAELPSPIISAAHAPLVPSLDAPFASALLSSDDELEPSLTPLEHPAAWTERAQAALFDLGVLASLAAVVVYFASRAAGSVAALRPVWPALAGYLGFLGLLYAVYFTGTCGRTIGKIVCGLRVVDTAGRPPGYARAFARALLGAIGIAAAMVALIPIFFDPARRALHDRLLRTRVVKY
jgi:uncharacterized RDD family membrane protein YckC